MAPGTSITANRAAPRATIRSGGPESAPQTAPWWAPSAQLGPAAASTFLEHKAWYELPCTTAEHLCPRSDNLRFGSNSGLFELPPKKRDLLPLN